MPSEFDRLVTELRTVNEIDALDARQQGYLLKSLKSATIGVTPGEWHIIKDSIGDAQRTSPAMVSEGDTAVREQASLRPHASAAALLPQPLTTKKRSAEFAARAGKVLKDLGAEIGAARNTLKEASREHRKMQRDAVRERTRSALAKALASFHAGQITGAELVTIEAHALRIDAQIALMERQ